MDILNVEYDLIFILDCLSQKERDEFRISEDLMDYLASQGIRQLQAKCQNRNMVYDAFSYMNKLADSGLRFCLQIVSHGTEKGLWIGDSNDDILWHELTDKFKILNTKLDNSLIVNMSTCKGLNGIKIVDINADKFPFFGLIGCNRDLYIDEAKKTNQLIYSKLLDGKDISKIISEVQDEFRKDKSEEVIWGISSQGYNIIKRTLGKR
jgi:hypothetical protein